MPAVTSKIDAIIIKKVLSFINFEKASPLGYGSNYMCIGKSVLMSPVNLERKQPTNETKPISDRVGVLWDRKSG